LKEYKLKSTKIARKPKDKNLAEAFRQLERMIEDLSSRLRKLEEANG
jgi:hypothetical protein